MANSERRPTTSVGAERNGGQCIAHQLLGPTPGVLVALGDGQRSMRREVLGQAIEHSTHVRSERLELDGVASLHAFEVMTVLDTPRLPERNVEREHGLLEDTAHFREDMLILISRDDDVDGVLRDSTEPLHHFPGVVIEPLAHGVELVVGHLKNFKHVSHCGCLSLNVPLKYKLYSILGNSYQKTSQDSKCPKTCILYHKMLNFTII